MKSDQREVTMLDRLHAGASVGGPEKSPAFQASTARPQHEWGGGWGLGGGPLDQHTC